MFWYQCQLAWRSMKKNPGLCLLMIVAIGFGVAAAMVAYTSHYLMQGNPLAHKDERVAILQTDAWHEREPYPGKQKNQMADTLSYRDVKALSQSSIPRYIAPIVQWGGTLNLPDYSLNTTMAFVRLTTQDFFPLFEAPFAYGAPWDKSADAQFRNQVVLSHDTNIRLFSGSNSVGREILLEGEVFQVSGVLAPWNLGPKRPDNLGTNNDVAPQIYAPISLIEHRPIFPWASKDCPDDAETFEDAREALLRGSCQWLNLWLEFHNSTDKEVYGDFVAAYIQSQKAIGRYPRPLKYALSTPSEKIKINGLDRSAFYLNNIIGWALLSVCMINSVALLLAKFLRQTREIGVRRALGASRAAIFIQHLLESTWIGLLGGVLGLVLTLTGLKILRHAFTQQPTKGLSASTFDSLFVPDLQVLMLTMLAAVLASLAAGLYPAWRVCHVPVASHLKTQ